MFAGTVPSHPSVFGTKREAILFLSGAEQPIKLRENHYIAHTQAFSQKGVQASWDAPRTKNGRLWTPKFWGKDKLFSMISLSILIY
jgi:hypothetical protein